MKLCMGCMREIEDHLSACPYCGFNETALRQESYYLDPGTVVGGRYIVGRVLNYGGHTVSYLGMDAEQNRKVVVKEYLPSDFSTRSEGETDVTIYSGDGQEQFEQGLTNFLNEANRIQHLQGAEGIARVYDCVAENETGYVISEYVEGRTLKEILDGGKKYSAEEAAAFIRRILQGLAKVHRMDIVHCDISPETIMVTETGEIKLMDFGATRYVTTANSKSLSIILKRGYAPEEQYRSRGKRGPWTDVYAVGAVMYRMLTGAVPQESVERALSDELKEPSKMGVSIPKNMENALMNALNVYQEDRTPSAEEFLNELNAENVKRIRVKQKKNKTGKFPVWAKGLVAVLACAVVAGGAYVIHNNRENNASVSKDQIIMKDLRGKTMEEASAYIEELNNENKWNIQLETEESVFDLTKGNGAVYSQSISPGTLLYTPEKENREETETAEEREIELPEGWTQDGEGKITGTVSLRLYTHEKLRYSEIRGLNAYELAQKLKIDTKDGTHFAKAEEKEGTNYFDLASIEAEGKVITAEDLENQEEELAYSGDIKINYYASDFFYWKSLPDFAAYGTIDEVPEQPLYQYENEKDRVQTGARTPKEGSLIDEGYYALKSETYDVGTIVGQTVEPGEEYDGTDPGETPLKINVIGKVFDYQGKTGQEIYDEIREADQGHTGFGYCQIIGERGRPGGEEYTWWQNQPVLSVKVYEAGVNEKGERYYDEEKEESYFKKEGPDNINVCFVITVEEPVPETQKVNPNSGSYKKYIPSNPGSAPSGSGGSGGDSDANGKSIE